MFDFLGSMPTEDRLVYELSALYEQYGYRKFCMAKFEEYSFYSDNRDFLSGEGVIAFNNSDGRLMALKPDITLSIVKNAQLNKDSLTKAYYNENVYRISDETHDYKEIKQMGIELLGEVDDYSIGEMVSLALKSLNKIDNNHILCVSHMAFISSVLAELDVSSAVKKEIILCEKNKNSHDLKIVCQNNSICKKYADYFIELTRLNGSFEQVLSSLKRLSLNEACRSACDELESLFDSLKAVGLEQKLQLDLSILNHSSYYNGIVFSGYVKNSPSPVLAGGRYDKLAGKIRKGTGALGFAVYLDNLNLYYCVQRTQDNDVLIINKNKESSALLIKEVEAFISKGFTVRVEKKIPENCTANKIYVFENKQLREVKSC